MTQYTRQGDGGGRLRVTVDDDGDVHLAINPAPGQSGLEFCTGMGGERPPPILAWPDLQQSIIYPISILLFYVLKS